MERRHPVEMRRGVLHLDGEPRPFLATDYPYYRDDPANWGDRLRAQREAGLDLLTFYVPWRHHGPDDPLRGGHYDFVGATQPNRDVVRLLELAETEGLRVILKPGPFVHAELPYGGLPDYVDPERNPAVESELDADGLPVRWSLARMPAALRRPLPAPFGHAYNAYVRHWMLAVARSLLADRAYPRGPVVGVQLMNEGIYSDSSYADPLQLGYAVSTLQRFHAFLREKYGTLDAYNDAHTSHYESWHEIDPPRRVELLAAAPALLRYLDWSEFQSRLYTSCARLYREYLLEGGLDRSLPCLFNFNPNGRTYRTLPASNDGWYTRVNLGGTDGFAFGTTNWLGVVAGDERAFRQYIMAASAWRGPAMEQNWGFSVQYDEPYRYTTPSHFESMAGMACGATGITAYTLAGTRAWRDDPNLRGPWMPERTSGHLDLTVSDYPGSAPIRSDGRRGGKYWSLRQIAQWLEADCPSYLGEGPAAPIAWAIYPRYAWAGQWLPRGDPDDLMWRPPLKAIPRGAYHGLDAFVEMMIGRGVGFRQVDISVEDAGLDAVDVLCMSGHEYMDNATQERLASWVERGGRLLLTNLVPDKDECLRSMKGALAERVFPHGELGARTIAEGPVPLTVAGETLGLALQTVQRIVPPEDADFPILVGDDVVGYHRRVGAGRAIYLGMSPWYARASGDDARIAQANQRLAWRLVDAVTDEPVFRARPLTAPSEVMVWEQGRDPIHRHLVVIVREADGEIEVDLGGEDAARLLLVSPSQSVHAVTLDGGRPAAAYLKGVNDARNERVPPWALAGGVAIGAADACDVCVTPGADRTFVVSVAHLESGSTRVRLPVAAGDVVAATDDAGAAVRTRAREGAAEIEVRDVAEGGAVRVRLAPAARRPTRPLS